MENPDWAVFSFESVVDIDAAARTHALVIEHAFQNTSLWEYEKMLGNGANGIVLLLRDRRYLPHSKRRAVLKVPFGDDGRGAQDLIREINAYKQVRGCSHIMEMLAYSEDVQAANEPTLSPGCSPAEVIRIVLHRWRRHRDTVFRPLREARIQGPAILLDYLENGSMLDFYHRVQDGQVRRNQIITLPNRLLWSFYYCMVRACVGIAYPPALPDNSRRPKLELETIPDGVEPTRLAHNDIALRNVMIADRDPDGPPEHQLVEKIVLIDFGRLANDPTAHEAMAANLSQISEQMEILINISNQASNVKAIEEHLGIYTYASIILPQRGVNHFPHLDPRLRDLIALGMALRPEDVPPLEFFLREAAAGMAKPASEYVGREREESDAVIRAVMQVYTLDA